MGKSIGQFGLIAVLCLIGSPLFARSFQGFMEVQPGVELYVDYKEPELGYKVMVPVNGLTYSTTDWNRFVDHFEGKPWGILRWDMRGQGRSLSRSGALRDVVPIEQQADDLHFIKDQLGIRDPLVPVGLSYGGGVTLQYMVRHPDDVAAGVLMAPYTGPIKSQDTYIRYMIRVARLLYPRNPSSDEDLYNYFLAVLVYTTFPIAEPSMLSSPLKPGAVLNLTKGALHSLAGNLVPHLRPGSLHIMKAGQDQYLDRGACENLWSATPQDARASWLEIAGSEHKIPERFPEFAAAWVEKILQGDKRLSGGRQFIGQPTLGRATSGDLVIPMPKEY